MSVKINTLEVENTKRIKAVQLEPNKNGLTVIGGKNGEGKTSVLDAICWALGGESYRPKKAARDGSVLPPHIAIELSNGIKVERKGKNSALTVIDTTGKRAGQTLLNGFIDQLALDLPRFMEASDKEKASTLLNIIGVEDELNALRKHEKKLSDDRLYLGRVAKAKQGAADELPSYPDAPEEMLSASELIRQQQAILAQNGENERKRSRLREITMFKHNTFDELGRIDKQIEELTKQKEGRLKDYEKAVKDEETAMKTVNELKDESTKALEKNIADLEDINIMVRANFDRKRAAEEAQSAMDDYNTKKKEIADVREKITNLLKGADLPLPELSVDDDGALTYRGFNWDGLSGSEQLRVATAIVRRLNPECGFVLLDKLEQMDTDTLKEFGAWLESEGLQAIATRVSTGDECSIVIEDGTYVPDEKPEPTWDAEEW